MAVLPTSNPTLLDVARYLDPNGNIAKIVMILMKYNDILDDMPSIEGNLPTGHQTNVETSKPTPTLRLVNQGVVPAKATAKAIVDGLAMLENRNNIDINVARLNGNVESFRQRQSRSFIQGFMDEVSRILIYGDTSTDAREFNGLASRYFALSGQTTSGQLITAGGSGSDNTSIWLVKWGEDTVFTVYPKGSKAGMQFEDLGIQDVVTDATTGAIMRAYTAWFQWLIGLVVADYRAVVRICNIDKSDLITASDTSDTSANILKFMSQAYDLLPPGQNGKPCFYMNNTVLSMLRVKLLNKGNLCLSFKDVMGPGEIARKELHFYDIPCRRVDAILNTEATIS